MNPKPGKRPASQTLAPVPVESLSEDGVWFCYDSIVGRLLILRETCAVKQNSKIKVRQATIEDLPVLVEFQVELGLHVSGAERKTLTRQASRELESTLRDYIDDEEKYLVVACTDRGRVIGMGDIRIWRTPSLWQENAHLDTKCGFIDDLWVVPDYRNRGIMNLILHALIGFAEDHAIEELVLEYSLNNKEAARVWEKLGFAPTGVRAAAWTRAVREKLSSGKKATLNSRGKEG